ncbi:MAG: efflux RND transporter periplasmic adaptor subunit [Parachlamydiales bacterium]
MLLLILCSCEKKQHVIVVPPVNVEVCEVSVRDFTLTVEAIGNVYENAIVQIRPQVQGILLRKYFEEGQFVKEGDLLYEIDPRPYQAILDQAKAALLKDESTLELAKITLKRNEELIKKDFISKLTWEQYQSNVMTAQAQVEIDKAAIVSAEINLDYCKIYAPLTGKLSSYNIFPGNLVYINDPNALIEIRQLSPVRIQFAIPQVYFQELHQIQPDHNLTFEAILPYKTNPPITGKIYFVDNHVDLQSGTIIIKGLIQNEDLVLWPGEYVTVKVFLKTIKNALTIPSAAVQVGQKGSYVYIVNPDMTATTRNITTGQKDKGDFLVLSGLKKGEKIVINGQLNLKEGSKVNIAPKAVKEPLK